MDYRALQVKSYDIFAKRKDEKQWVADLK